MRNGVKCYDNFNAYLCFACPRLVSLLRFPQQQKRRYSPLLFHVRNADWPVIILQLRLPDMANHRIDWLNHRLRDSGGALVHFKLKKARHRGKAKFGRRKETGCCAGDSMIGSYRSGVRLRSSKAGSGSGCQRRLNARAASNLGNYRVDVAHRVRIFFNSNLYSTAL